MRYLTAEEVLEINAEVMGGRRLLRDRGLLESAVARRQASALGADAYPGLVTKAAALLHSLVLNHAFVERTKQMKRAKTKQYQLNPLNPLTIPGFFGGDSQ